MSAEETDQSESAARTSKYLTFAAVGLGTYVGYKLLFGGSLINSEGFRHIPDAQDEMPEYPRGEKYWTTNPWEKLPIRVSKRGVGSMKPTTLFKVIDAAVAADPHAPHFKWETEDEKSGEWTWNEISRSDFQALSKTSARAMIKLGMQPWEAASIIGFNSLPWFAAAFGAMYAGGLMTGQYATNNPGQTKYIANHSKSRVVFTQNEKQAMKLVVELPELETVSAIVMWEGDAFSDELRAKFEEKKGSKDVKLLLWDEFLAFGNGEDKDELAAEMEKRVAAITPEQCLTLIYTSGTTGPPKAVMLSHDNVLIDCKGCFESNRHLDFSGEHASVSYLPLSHIAGQLADFYLPYTMMAWENSQSTVFIARPTALKGTLVMTLKAARPTIFFGVPRVWEKIEDKMKTMGKASGGVKKMIGDWAKAKGLEGLKARQIGGSGVYPDAYGLAKKLVFDKVKASLGFDRLMLAVTGAAPIKGSTISYFGSLGFNIVEVFGMSETCGYHTLGKDFFNLIGSVGLVMKSSEVVIQHDPARDRPGEGEMCLRGRNVMMGYMYDEDKTRGAIDDEGLLHSGDVGRIDDNGLLHITGRIKELIITAGGENVAPVPIEDFIKTELPGVSNFTVIGDNRKFLTALVTLKLEQNMDTMHFSDKLTSFALDVSAESRTLGEAKRDPKWKEYIQAAIDKYNADPEICVSRAQKIQYFTILDSDFGVETGEMTSTLKLKRSVVHTKFKDTIDRMYPSA